MNGIASMAIVAMAMALALVACSSEPESSPATGDEGANSTVEVEVESVTEESVTQRRRWSGQLKALNAYAVKAAHRGVVQGLEVREGDRVEAGQVVARLSGPAAGERRAVLGERVDHLREELQRWERLSEGGAAGPAEVNEAKLRLLDAQQERAELDSEFAGDVIRAPVAGRVRIQSVAARGNVSAGDELFIIDDDDAVGLEINLAASETVHLEQSHNIVARDGDGEEYPIDRVVYSDDQHPGFVTARIYLDDVEDDRRRQVEVIYEAREDVLIVPWTAVAVDDERRWVAVVDPDTAEIERRSVELGRAHQAGIEVIDGLEGGEVVVRYEPRNHPAGTPVTARERHQ